MRLRNATAGADETWVMKAAVADREIVDFVTAGPNGGGASGYDAEMQKIYMLFGWSIEELVATHAARAVRNSAPRVLWSSQDEPVPIG